MEGSAGTKVESGQVHRVSVGAGHDRSSVQIGATRREQTKRGAVKGRRMGTCWERWHRRTEEAQCTVRPFNVKRTGEMQTTCWRGSK